MQWRISLENILVCKKIGDHEILWSAKQFWEERNVTGNLDVGFSVTNLKEQNTVSNILLPQIWLWNQLCSTASQDHCKSWSSRQLASLTACQEGALGTWEHFSTGNQKSFWKSQRLSLCTFHEAMRQHKGVNFPACEGAFWHICHTPTFLRGPMNLLRSILHITNGTSLLFIVINVVQL